MVALILSPLLFVAGCSDGDDGSSAAAITTGATTTSQPTDTTQTNASGGTAPAEATLTGSVRVDFTGAPEELPAIDMTFEVEAGSTAWDAVRAALGEENLDYQDFGGDLGIFITGFNGVEAQGNHFWEFKPNGETAEVGVSKYEVQQGDVLEFAYSSF